MIRRCMIMALLPHGPQLGIGVRKGACCVNLARLRHGFVHDACCVKSICSIFCALQISSTHLEELLARDFEPTLSDRVAVLARCTTSRRRFMT